MGLATLMDFQKDDFLKDLFFESGWQYAMNDLDEWVKFKTKMFITREVIKRQKIKESKLGFCVNVLHYHYGYEEPFPEGWLSNTLEGALGEFYGHKEFVELCIEDNVFCDNRRYFFSFSRDNGKLEITGKHLGKFDGVWV